MNIFGSFTFGSLIKTFLPGLVWLFALCLLHTDFAQWHGLDSQLWSFIQGKDQTLVALAIIPASILLGLLSNIVVFMGLNDFLVRKPVKADCAELFTLHERLTKKLRDTCWDALKLNDPALRKSFDDNTDPEVILVERIGFEQLAYVREQYWYHLEFQLNLLMSIVALMLSLIFSVVINVRAEWSFCLVLAIASFGSLMCWGLLRAARKNYSRHIGKMASLLVALLSNPEDSSGMPPTGT